MFELLVSFSFSFSAENEQVIYGRSLVHLSLSSVILTDSLAGFFLQWNIFSYLVCNVKTSHVIGLFHVGLISPILLMVIVLVVYVD